MSTQIPGTQLPICTLCEEDAGTVQSDDLGLICAECAAIVGVMVSLAAQNGLTVCRSKTSTQVPTQL